MEVPHEQPCAWEDQDVELSAALGLPLKGHGAEAKAADPGCDGLLGSWQAEATTAHLQQQ